MKLNRIFLALLVAALFSACHNDEISYPDFDYTTVYFASQYPLRTVELGKDLEVDNTIDNEHKIKILATTGGEYSNTETRTIDFVVDDSLCNDVTFEDGAELKAMPSSYYELAANQITIKAGTTLGGVEVKLNDAFFADPASYDKKYVIPLLITNVNNADSILSGKTSVDSPNRLKTDDWVVAPKDYVLYAVKYVNPYHAHYYRRGVDVVSGAVDTTIVRHKEYVEYNEEVAVATRSLKGCVLPLTFNDPNSSDAINVELILTFDAANNCTITSNAASYSITGSGKFVTDGEKNSMGGRDRDGLYLDYSVTLTDLGYTYATKDTLVCRNRGVKPEYYSVKVQ